MADDVKDQGRRRPVRRRSSAASRSPRTAAQSAQETVQEKGREHSEELATSAQQNMQEATSNAR